MLEAVDFNFQSNLYSGRYFRLNSEQHGIVIPFLFRNSIRKKIEHFTKTIHDGLDWTWIDLNQVNVLTIAWLG